MKLYAIGLGKKEKMLLGLVTILLCLFKKKKSMII